MNQNLSTGNQKNGTLNDGAADFSNKIFVAYPPRPVALSLLVRKKVPQRKHPQENCGQKGFHFFGNFCLRSPRRVDSEKISSFFNTFLLPCSLRGPLGTEERTQDGPRRGAAPMWSLVSNPHGEVSVFSWMPAPQQQSTRANTECSERTAACVGSKKGAAWSLARDKAQCGWQATKMMVILLAGFLMAIMPARPVQAVNSGNFTMSLWLNPSGSVASKALISKAEEFRVFTDANGKPGCQVKTTSWQTAVGSSTAISVGSWAHVVCTYDLVNLKIYVNGVLRGTQAETDVPDDTAAVLRIGQDDSASTTYTNFSGIIDEFRFYNYALTSDEVLLDFNAGSALKWGSVSDTSGLTGGSTASSSASAAYCIPGDTTSCAAPVAEWNFEEGSGTSVADTSGNANTGTWIGGGAQWGSGRYGKAGVFNGGNNYVEETNVGVSYDSATGVSVTWEIWINNKGATTNRVVLQQPKSDHSDAQGTVRVDSANVVTTIIWEDGANRTIGTANIGTNSWHHVAVVINQSTDIRYLYVDGLLNASDNYTGIGTWPYTDFHIGNNYLGTTGFNGSIDQVRIFNYARTAAQVAWDYNRGAPVGHWKFNECTGTTLHDSASATNSATLTGATAGTCDDASGTSFWNQGTSGKYGASGYFDGTNDVAAVTKGLNYVQAVSFWAKPTTNSQSYLQLNTASYITSSDGTVSATGFTSPTIYVNGVANGTVTAGAWNYIVVTTGTSISANTIKFGLQNATYYSGQLDDARIFNYALTAAQVKTLFNENAAVRFGP